MFNQDESVSLEKLKNGWLVKRVWQTEFTDRGGHKDTDWHEEVYAYSSLDKAIDKVTELANKFDD